MSDDLMRDHRGEAVYAWWVPVSGFNDEGSDQPVPFGLDWLNAWPLDGNPNRLDVRLMGPVERGGKMGTHLLATRSEQVSLASFAAIQPGGVSDFVAPTTAKWMAEAKGNGPQE